MIRRFIYILAAFLLALPVPAAFAAVQTDDDSPVIRPGKSMHYSDTLNRPKEREQFLEAIRIAPETFVYEDIKIGQGVATIKGLRLNSSMDNTLQTAIVKADPRLEKKFRRINGWTRALGAACDLKVTWRTIETGAIYVEYDISRIRFFVFREP